MATNRVDVSLFKKMVINGATNLKNNYKEVDELNVFPVPDGDTGTNMQMTIMAGVREIENVSENTSFSSFTKTLSRGTLMGARGNSGVILSQFFRGIYNELENVSASYITIEKFASALINGYKIAYKAVMQPVEGTILTVVREAGEMLEKDLKAFNNIQKLMEAYLNQAKKTLAYTPELLPVLKEAGVVDSGGAGFVKIIEGMVLALKGKILALEESTSKSSSAAETVDADIKYGYCTEFIVQLEDPKSFEEDVLREYLLNMGDSLVIVQDDELLKVHVHVNRPGDVLNKALEYGFIRTTKIENMRLQHTAIIEAEAAPKEKQKYALISVCFGDGIKKTFKDLGVDYIIDGGQTMNPSTEDFINAIKEVNAENVIILPNNSNVILAAEQAAKLCENENVRVLKCKTLAAGYASLMVFDQNNTIDENFEDMTRAIQGMKAGEITYAVRDTEIKGVKIESGDFMGISQGDILVSVKDRIEATKSLLEKMIDDDSEIITIFYGKDVLEEEVAGIEEYLEEFNPDIEIEIIPGMQDIYSYIIAVE